ncbi:MAG TPA: multidrug efflux RND transporter permease subunit [Alphaproteobacteria bacterium]|nr:multidrug efflux RND transporter permease subunit [Alphaproteobacteria bacterium]
MGFSKTFIDRPIATALLMAAILLSGIVAFGQLPVAAIPKVDYPTIQVSAVLPGADPETMASSVATPLERQFSQIADLTQMTSTSTLSNTTVSLQFDLSRNIDAAAQDVQAAISAAGGQLPKTLPNPPTWRKVNPADRPILLFGMTSDVLPLDVLDDLTDTKLAQQLSQIQGVSQVFIFGEQKPAVRVQVDPARLANQGLSLEDVRAAVAAASVDAPKGTFDGAYQSSTIAANDQILNADGYRKLIVAYRNGAPVRISDVGTALDSVENVQLAAFVNAHRGITVAVFRQPEANVITTTDAVKAELARLSSFLPPSAHVEILADRTQTVRASVADVEITLMITIALVVMVIFLFLRKVWATVIPATAVPLSLIGTFGAMYLLGYSIDNLSLMALTIAVGFVVDDAIVMIENIVRHIEEGDSAYEAAVKGSRQIGFTIISITVSLIAVFIPLLLMGGLIGRLFHEFAMTVTVAVVISALVSLTLTPTMCARFLGNDEERHGKLYMALENFFDWLVSGYSRGLRFVLGHRRLTILSLLATVALTVVMFLTIPKGFFPQQDNGLIIGATEASLDISFAEMVRKQEAAAAIVLQDPAVATLMSSVGSGGGQTTNTGRLFIQLKPFDQRPGVTTDDVINRLRPKFAQMQGFRVYGQSSQDITVGTRQSRTQYQYTLQDADIDELGHWANVMVDKMRAIPGLTDVTTDQQDSAPRTALKIDRDTASRLGISAQAIDDTLYDAFGQRQVATIFTQLNQYHVVLEVDPKYQQDPSSLRRIYVKSATGAQVPLSAFAAAAPSTSALSINHQGQFPAITISFNLAPGVALGDATARVEKAARDAHMPATVTPTFQGNAQAFHDSLSTIPLLIAAALVAVYIVLGILYESFIHPLTILSTLPSAGVGALLMLWLFHYPLDMMALIGIILLIGIVKKNAIMMIDFALEAERHQGLPPAEAIYQAALLRFRPIMMTTMSALFSGLPLMLGNGAGSELRRPLGFAIVGGLILSQALTLFTTPVVYLYLDRFSNRMKARRRSHAEHKETAAHAESPGSTLPDSGAHVTP